MEIPTQFGQMIPDSHRRSTELACRLVLFSDSMRYVDVSFQTIGNVSRGIMTAVTIGKNLA